MVLVGEAASAVTADAEPGSAGADEVPATEAAVGLVGAVGGSTALPFPLSRLDGRLAGAVLDSLVTGEGARALPSVWDGPASSGFDSDAVPSSWPGSPSCVPDAVSRSYASRASLCDESGSQYRG